MIYCILTRNTMSPNNAYSTDQEIINMMARYKAFQVEERIRLVIKPKPDWMPECVWMWLLSKFLNMEFFPYGVDEKPKPQTREWVWTFGGGVKK